MILYYVMSENDIGLNLDGYNGCYSTKEKVDEILKSAMSCGYFEGTIEEEIDSGLLIIKEIEG